MDPSDFRTAVRSRGTDPSVPSGLLQAAWREAAERAVPACVLVPRDDVPVVAWVNGKLCELLAMDAADLVARPLRELVDPACAPEVPTVPPAADLAAELGADLAAELGADLAVELDDGQALVVPALVPAQARPERQDDLPRQPDHAAASPVEAPDPEPVDWARLTLKIIRTGGGRGVAGVRSAGGTDTPVQVSVTPVVPSERAPQATPRVPRPGTVEQLSPSPSPAAWLVTLEPTLERLSDLRAELSIAENRFTALADAAPVGILVSDVGLRLGYVNERFAQLVGQPAHALLGTGWLDGVHQEDLQNTHTAVQTVLGGTPVEVIVRFATAEGPHRWLQLRLAPVTTPVRAAGFIGTAENVTDRRSWEEHLSYQAQHDPLTGLANRRHLIDVLNDLLGGWPGRRQQFAVLFVDLDGFKEVNDRYGHEAGDRALIETAQRMARVARDSDLIARVAGDEFVMVLQDVKSAKDAEAAARRFLEAVAVPIRLGRNVVELSASIGIALPVGFDTPDSLLRAADRVMYEAKAAGPGLYRLAPMASGEEPR